MQMHLYTYVRVCLDHALHCNSLDFKALNCMYVCTYTYVCKRIFVYICVCTIKYVYVYVHAESSIKSIFSFTTEQDKMCFVNYI